MITNFQKVTEFNNSFDVFINPNLHTLKLNEQNIDPKLIKLKCDLIIEEIKELKDSIDDNDFVEYVDALSDILYVVYGAGLSFGINLDHEYALYLESLFKDFTSNTQFNNFENTKKLFNFKQCNLKSSFRDTTYNILDLNKSKLILLREYFDTNISPKIASDKFKNILLDCLYNVYVSSIAYRIDIDTAFDIVHKSNMSKLALDENIAKSTVENYIKKDIRYDTPNYRQSPNKLGWIIYNESTNKVLKSIEYTPADFSTLSILKNDWLFKNI